MNSTIFDEENTTIRDFKLIALLRHFSLERMIEKRDAFALYRNIYQDNQTLEDALPAINESLQYCKLQIALNICEVDSKEYYVLFSTHYKADSVWSSGLFNDNQLDYFQNILRLILISENGAISSIDCLNSNKKLTKSDAQDFLITLINRKYLMKLPEGRLTVSPLTICELLPFFEKYFQEALNCCEICKKLTIHGVSCPSCNVHCHKYCYIKYKKQMSRVKCPRCNATWNEDL